MIKPEPAGHLAVQAARLRADLQHADVTGVVDEQRRGREPLGGLDDLGPALLRDAPLAELLALDLRLGSHEPLRELGLGHLQREQRDRLPMVHGGVLGDVRDQGRFTHGRSCRDHDEVSGLEASRQLVEVLEARRGAGERLAFLGEAVQLVELAVEDVVDRLEVLLAIVLRDLEHGLLGPLDQRAGRAVAGHDARLDLVRGVQQAPQERVVANDLRVMADVPRRLGRADECVDGVRAADALELARLPEVLDDRDRVDGLGGLVESEHRAVDGAVTVAVEMVGTQALVDDEAVHRPLGEQDGAEDGLLRVEVVGRDDAGALGLAPDSVPARHAHRRGHGRSRAGGQSRGAGSLPASSVSFVSASAQSCVGAPQPGCARHRPPDLGGWRGASPGWLTFERCR